MILGTHGGYFHLDDVMAFVILRMVFNDVQLIRTRDDTKLKSCDLVFDIGFGKYDHHQQDDSFPFPKRYRDNDKSKPYAACGLIWEEFGKKLIISLRSDLTPREVDDAFDMLDSEFIEPIDLIDNGVGRKPNYPTFSGFISSFNSTWEEPHEYGDITYFLKAADVAELGLIRKISDICARIKASKIVYDSYQRSDYNNILVLEKGVPWLEPIFRRNFNKILYVIHSQSNGEWVIQCVPKFKNMSKNLTNLRLPFPEKWAGLKGEELCEITKIPDCVFCHHKRYIAGTKSIESAIELSKLSISESKK